MFRCLSVCLVLFTLIFTSCTDGGGSDDPADREDELRETVPAAYTAIFAGGAVEAYSYASSEFKEKCSLEDFTGVIALVKVFLGDLDEEDVEVEVTDVRFEDERAYVTATGTIQGEEVDSEEDDEFSDYWVLEGDEWKWGTDEEEPCGSSFSTDGEDDDDDEPEASGPGSSRAEPLPLGDAIEIESLRYMVLEADLDAEDQIETLSDFPSTPEPGRRVVLARVQVAHVGESGDDSIEVYESDFGITGSNNVLYDSFGDGVSCGFVEDALSGEMFPGGELEGYVCFQVPEDETDLLLVVEPPFSFDDEGRRFLALE